MATEPSRSVDARAAPARRYAVAAALLGWGALLLQFCVTAALTISQGRGVAGGLFVFFGYFTILTNILAALALSAAAWPPLLRWFARPSVASGIAVSIALVGLVYSLVLRDLWQPTGAQRVADHLLHDLMPLVYLLYWWLWVDKADLRWRDALRWALYPLAYLVYALLRGAWSGAYPYPFIDVAALGYAAVARNAVGVLLAFGLIAALLLGLAGLQTRKRRAAASV